MTLRTPITLSDAQIKEFQELTKKHYGIELSREETLQQGIELIEFIAAVIEGDT